MITCNGNEMVFDYNTYPEGSKFEQKDAASLITPDGREVFGYIKYLDKVFKDSGLKSTKVVNTCYDITGDPDGKMDEIVPEGVVAVENGGNNFIYLSSMDCYNNFKELFKFFDDNNAVIMHEPSHKNDETCMLVKVTTGDMDFIFDVNLKSEWVIVYAALDHTDNRLHSFVMAQFYLNDGVAMSSALENVTNGRIDLEIPGTYRTWTFNDVITLLKSAGMVKYKGSKLVLKFSYDSCMEDENYQDLIDILDYINDLDKQYKLYDSKCFITKVDFLRIMDHMYKLMVQGLLSFNLSGYLWSHCHLGRDW